VVALAEGLQSSFWWLERACVADDVTWYSIDLPPVMELRRRLLPRGDRIVELPSPRSTEAGWTASTRRMACSSRQKGS
jgi:O-methyltransferase involved in polyketide biosynthesis